MSDEPKTQVSDEVDTTATVAAPADDSITATEESITVDKIEEETPSTPVETTDVAAVKLDKSEAEIEKEKIIAGLKPGMTVRVYQKIRETNPKGEIKERLQMYEGIILAIKHGREIGSTMTVRKLSGGVGVEKIFPLFSPNVAKIEMVKQAKVRQSKLYYLREKRKKKLREVKL